MGIHGYKNKYIHFNNPGDTHDLTFSCYNRLPFLKSEAPKQFLAHSINKAAEKHKFHVWAYVFMPEHVHLMIYPYIEDYSISKILKSIKQASSRKIINFLKENKPDALKHLETGLSDPKYRFWQDGGGYDRNYWSTDELRKQVTYIHENPVVRGLCEGSLDWEHSSARFWELGESGPVDVNLEFFPMW